MQAANFFLSYQSIMQNSIGASFAPHQPDADGNYQPTTPWRPTPTCTPDSVTKLPDSSLLLSFSDLDNSYQYRCTVWYAIGGPPRQSALTAQRQRLAPAHFSTAGSFASLQLYPQPPGSGLRKGQLIQIAYCMISQYGYLPSPVSWVSFYW